MIRVSEEIVIRSCLLPDSLTQWDVWVEQNGNRVTECGHTDDPFALEARAARAVRAHLGLTDHSLAGDLGFGVFNALAHVVMWLGRGL